MPNTIDKTSVEYNFFPTVPSQSFADLMSSTSINYSQNFWDNLVQQQQQQEQQLEQQLEHHQQQQRLDSVNYKPIGNLSQDLYHEDNSCAAAQMFDLSFHANMPFYQHSVIKDDVFLALPAAPITDTDDNVSLSSRSSLSSFQHGEKLPRSPCLSPVTSPTKFLYNHEPLFEGSIISTDETAALGYHSQDEHCDNTVSATQKQLGYQLSASGGIEWSKVLLDGIQEEEVCGGLSAPFETAMDDDHMSLSSLSSESDMESYVLLSKDLNKRKRITQDQPRKAPPKAKITKTPQKRGRKKKSTTTTAANIKKSLSFSEKNKETDPMNQLTEVVTSDEKRDKRTMFQQLTDAHLDWCRYCGTTEGVSWRPGPWGKRTLCNKHGCDYKGYGLANRIPRLDLSIFENEKLQDRIRPIIQEYCVVCQCPEQIDKEEAPSNQLICCQGGCSRAYHQQCHKPSIQVNPAEDSIRWYCSESCKENRKLKKVVVELPRKQMLLNLKEKALTV
ncbi:hypothetical protein [Parasitella parasitica]|uniref:PHD-type domain-containing protein n=1 Tax=Parasitella parasitica TaxID=35722 RepID=A0A0B7NGP8_9FUNG|nr:hypothetical protein [Parasitella parasitica]